jgi:uncharacterized Zn-binding protein involved in type VI secretion
MPAAAKKSGVSLVMSPHGVFNYATESCTLPLLWFTEQGSENVFVNDIGAVRVLDLMKSHPDESCGLHAPPLANGSPNVFVNGKAMGRVGDLHSGGEVIVTGSGNVFVNGNNGELPGWVNDYLTENPGAW